MTDGEPIVHRPIFQPHPDARSDLDLDPGGVYLIAGEGRHKIGKSIDVERRLKTFQAHSGSSLSLLHVIRSNFMSCLEGRLHRWLSAKKINREWFALDEQQEKAIRSLDCIVYDHQTRDCVVTTRDAAAVATMLREALGVVLSPDGGYWAQRTLVGWRKKPARRRSPAEFGARLLAMRQARKLSLGQVAITCGISRTAVNKLEAGQRWPRTDVLWLLADYYRLSLDELVGRRAR